MSDETLQYDARDVVLTWGAIELTGAAPGSFVKIAYDEDMAKKTVGAQGQVCVTINANDGGSITWTGGQQTDTNDKLSAIAVVQRKRGAPLFTAPILLKHVNGTTIAAGLAWIKKTADVEFGAEHGNREWPFDIDHLELFVGGSTR
jgi:hypothetical protein